MKQFTVNGRRLTHVIGLSAESQEKLNSLEVGQEFYENDLHVIRLNDLPEGEENSGLDTTDDEPEDDFTDTDESEWTLIHTVETAYDLRNFIIDTMRPMEPIELRYHKDGKDFHFGLLKPTDRLLGTSPSEALYAFTAWLTTRSEELTLGKHNDAARAAELLGRYCAHQGWPEPREGWQNNIKPTPEDL